MKESYENVFSALEDDSAKAGNLFIKSRLMLEIKKHIQEYGMTQKEASLQMGVTQPRISDLMRGKIELFTIDTLITMLEKSGVDVDVVVKPAAETA